MKWKNLADLALLALTRCIACDLDPPTAQTFPICQACENSLLPGLNRPNETYSLFQLTDDAYPVLRRWKTRRGPLFDHRVLKRVDSLRLKTYLDENQIQVIVPMPQNYRRSWKMGGSPALKIASFVSRITKIPLRSEIMSRARNLGKKRQAELSGWQRIQTRFYFNIAKNNFGYRSVLLVDDFSTTGHTLHEAASALKAAGYGKIHTLCLGARTRPLRQPEVPLPEQELSRAV